MSTYFVTRHQGAIEWASRQGISAELVSHFDPDTIYKGDIVIGTLPVNLVAVVNHHGGRYLHLSLDLPAEARGKELTADDMERYGARLQEFSVASHDFSSSTVLVGAWDDQAGEYGPEPSSEIRSTVTIQGANLELVCHERLEIPRCVYVERLQSSWRINVSKDDTDVHLQVTVHDSGEMTVE